MNSEPNPYAPPSVDPTRPSSASQDSGKLWRVVDDRLQVRNMASLPDVCVYGYPEGEPGTRQSLVLKTLPEWARQLMVLPALAILFLENLGVAGVGIFFLAIVLPGFLGKKVRLMIFRSRRAERGLMFRRVALPILVGVAVYATLRVGFHREWLPPEMSRFVPLGAVVVILLLLNFLPSRGPTRAITLNDGWFEVKGTAPEAVRRLEEIQQRASTPHRPA